jgi:hypothetical protein
VAAQFRERPLCFSSGGSTRGTGTALQLTHRLDAVFTVEVALKFAACERNFQSTGFWTSLGIIDQRESKT